MARDHGRVLCKIWQSKDFRALPRTAQAMYIQLLSQPTVNNAGVLPLQASKWAKGCDSITEEDVRGDLKTLRNAGYIVLDWDTEEVLIRSFIRNDGGMSHKYIFKNALTCAEAVESDLLRTALAIELSRLGRPEATRTAEILAPSEPDPDPIVIAPESHSDGIETVSESGMASESHSNHWGVGEGVGVSLVPALKGSKDLEIAPRKRDTARDRGTRLPEGWEPPADAVRQMRAEFPHVDLRAEHAKFLDYWAAQPGAKGRKAEWTATWRNWIRRAAERRPPTAGPRLARSDEKVRTTLDIGERLMARNTPAPKEIA